MSVTMSIIRFLCRFLPNSKRKEPTIIDTFPAFCPLCRRTATWRCITEWQSRDNFLDVYRTGSGGRYTFHATCDVCITDEVKPFFEHVPGGWDEIIYGSV